MDTMRKTPQSERSGLLGEYGKSVEQVNKFWENNPWGFLCFLVPNVRLLQLVGILAFVG